MLRTVTALVSQCVAFSLGSPSSIPYVGNGRGSLLVPTSPQGDQIGLQFLPACRV